MKKNLLYFIIFLGFGVSCSSTRNSGSTDNKTIDITFVQINDVYEIAPLEGGRIGGMARVAFIKNKYLTQNPNTYLIMAGDFLSPSVFNSLQFEGKRIRGRQMIEAMNTAGTDIAVFGNHEFDISESELQSRINESGFKWLSSNTYHKKGDVINQFVKKTGNINDTVPLTYIMNVKDADGTTARIGFIGLTLPYNKASYVMYTDPLVAAETMYNRIKDSCDVVIAITHQLLKDDILLAQRLPNLAMIIGGHEHDQRFQRVGNVIISKAHSNAKSAYILKLKINKNKADFKVKSELEMINESVPMDPVTEQVVKKWTAIADKSYSSIGFDAKKIIRTSGDPLDGRDAEIRTHPTNFSRIIVAAMEAAAPGSDLAILNAGSIRLDDILQMPVSQYDILRSLPFGGNLIEADMIGSLLVKILDAGRKNAGIGGFLHYSNSLTYSSASSNWTLQSKEIDPLKSYKVVMTDFLLTGGEANLGFLKKDNPQIIKVYPVATSLTDPKSDIRLSIIRYMENQPASAF
ncbi:MAG: bifunctional metallophosphatase/5'-nucleotidase [Ferruginibacter sp.]